MTQHVMANGRCQSMASGRWAVLGLRFIDDSVTAVLDGELLTTQKGLVANAGVCGFGSGWHEAHFEKFQLSEVAGHSWSPGSFLYDLLPPNRTTVQRFNGQWVGMVMDVHSSLQVQAVGRLQAPGDKAVYRVNINPYLEVRMLRRLL